MMPTFIQAASDGDLEALRQHPELVRVRHEGATPLHYAALHGQLDAMQWLLENGAELEARDDEYNATPVQWAHEKGHAYAVEWLFARGARLGPLQAASFGKPELLALYVAARPDLLEHEEDWGTVVHAACIWGRESVLEWLIADGRADLRLRSLQGFTPLEICERQSRNARLHTPIVTEARKVEIEAACARMAERLQQALSDQRQP